MSFDADLIVIGSGPAGEKGAVQAAYFGKRVILVEREPQPGGTAVHTGTLPSKSFRETALMLSQGRLSESPLRALLDRKDAVRAMEVDRIRHNLERHSVRLLHGRARVTGPHTVAVEGRQPQTLSAEFILVATGSVPHHPDTVDFADPAIDDADSFTQMPQLPKTLTVIGGGVIGCEYASIFAEVGVKVTLAEERPRLMPWLDAATSVRLQHAFAEQGIRVHTGEGWSAIGRDGDEIRTMLQNGVEIRSERLLYAAGRVGATGGLGLADLGISINSRGYIAVDDAFRTAVPSILAAGDVIGAPALASTSMEQGRVAVCRAFGFEYKREVGDLLPTSIFTIPEVAAVGLTEERARAEGLEPVSGWAPYARSARGILQGSTTGGVKLVFDAASRRLVGAHLIGERSSELVHIGQALIALGGTVDSIIDQVFSYPTLAESYKYAAYDALGKLNEIEG